MQRQVAHAPPHPPTPQKHARHMPTCHHLLQRHHVRAVGQVLVHDKLSGWVCRSTQHMGSRQHELRPPRCWMRGQHAVSQQAMQQPLSHSAWVELENPGLPAESHLDGRLRHEDCEHRTQARLQAVPVGGGVRDASAHVITPYVNLGVCVCVRGGSKCLRQCDACVVARPMAAGVHVPMRSPTMHNRPTCPPPPPSSPRQQKDNKTKPG
jgi:hypothetical protein